jgi:hypothetical protein
MSGLVTAVAPVKVIAAGQAPPIGACPFERVIVLVAMPEPESPKLVDVIVTEVEGAYAGTLIVPVVSIALSASSVSVVSVALVPA